MLLFHSPEVMQQNFAIKFNTHSLEEYELPTELKPFSCVKKC